MISGRSVTTDCEEEAMATKKKPEKIPCPYRGRSESERKEFEDRVPPRIKCRKCDTQLEVSEPNRFYWLLSHPNKGFVEEGK